MRLRIHATAMFMSSRARRFAHVNARRSARSPGGGMPLLDLVGSVWCARSFAPLEYSFPAGWRLRPSTLLNSTRRRIIIGSSCRQPTACDATPRVFHPPRPASKTAARSSVDSAIAFPPRACFPDPGLGW
ncbi:hypothetical protein C8R43DRAFT_1131466 [Mycena crocata]|nr:hypothetical protein C8R43DRAFT_1131466 [Mycena crocata]